jgi:hypothetical protein
MLAIWGHGSPAAILSRMILTDFVSSKNLPTSRRILRTLRFCLLDPPATREKI